MTTAAAAVTPATYETRALEVSLGGQRVLGPIDLQLGQGTFVGILGPNGSGKTTLLRALTGGVKPTAGEIVLQGRPLRDHRPAELARIAGVVPQQFSLDFSFTVEEMAAMGRYAQGAPAADGEAVAAALEATGMTELSGRLITELSGGERQRALIAQTLAQQTPVLLLDEPLNNLDLNHQLEIMQLLRSLHAEGRTIAVVLHDLNIAAQYCDELVLLDHGRLAAQGTPDDILDPTTILEVFKVRVAVHRQGPRPYLTPVWSRAPEGPQAGRRAVHVIAGGGAASALLDELVAHGFAPTVGIVSVFDSDYAAAERYELEMVSAPPFEPFPPEVVQEFDALAGEAEIIIVAPVFFGRGNLAPLRTALEACRAGKRVLVMTNPPIGERDLCDGEATCLVAGLLEAGALEVTSITQAVEAAIGPRPA
ncbi:MAG: ABC transporter ATP-binding protein [Thermoleophilia bacterium]|nr:ABC transporter ATP-binding protein [Thermoleophilia bacterium]